MGREIRRVPANWEHPKYTAETRGDFPYHRVGHYMPLNDEHIDDVFFKWQVDFDRVRSGNLTNFERECYPNGLADWINDEGKPPDPAYYRPYKDNEREWFQVYETVSEGTPVTPPFATREELIDYLATKGDFWDQTRGDGAWSRKNAEAFVNRGWAPSMIVEKSASGAHILQPRDGLPETK